MINVTETGSPAEIASAKTLAVYGIALDVPPLETLLTWRKGIEASDAPEKGEVLLACGDSSRTCTFEELVAFMTGKGRYFDTYEDELPAGMTDEEHKEWFTASAVVDGVRMGKRFKREGK